MSISQAWWRIAMALVLGLSLSGCLHMRTTIHVNPDGSGQLVEVITMDRQGFKGASLALGAQPVSEAKLKERIASLGGAVRVVSNEAVQDGTHGGTKVVYAFDDINRLRYGMNKDDKQGGLAYTFQFTPGAKAGTPATLRIINREDLLAHVNRPIPPEEQARLKDMLADPRFQNVMRQLQQVMTGAKLDLRVEVAGQITATTARHASGSTIQLLAMDFDQVARSPAFLEAFTAVNMGMPSDIDPEKVEIPGMTAEYRKEVEVSFR